MEKQGWASIHRSIQDHWLWEEKPFDKGTALIDLVLSADNDSKEFLISINSLSRSWGWNKVKVCNFLNLLQDKEFISKHKTKDNQKWIIEIKENKYFEL